MDEKIKEVKLRTLVELYYDHQDVRLRSDGRIRAMEAEFGKENSESQEIEILQKKSKQFEKDIIKMIKPELKVKDIYTKYFQYIQGLGPVLSAGLIAWIPDITRFDTAGKLYAYAGLSSGYYLIECEEGHKFVSASMKTECGRSIWKKKKGGDEHAKKEFAGLCKAGIKKYEKVEGAMRRVRGYQSSWNPKLKVLLWKIGESFVKSHGGYRQYYDQFRETYDNRADLKEASKARRYAMAKRKTVKLFVSHMLEVAYKLKGLQPKKPFAIGKLKHSTYIPPFIDTKKKGEKGISTWRQSKDGVVEGIESV